MSTLVIGIGNPARGDDGAGIALAERLRQAVPAGVSVVAASGEPAALIEAWARAERVVLVDSCTGKGPAGSIEMFEAAAAPLPAELLRSSTHSLGVAEAIELARALKRLPKRLTVYGIAARRFDAQGLSAPVAAAVERLAGRLAAELAQRDAASTSG
jgi:hydrogenase maturation protease